MMVLFFNQLSEIHVPTPKIPRPKKMGSDTDRLDPRGGDDTRQAPGRRDPPRRVEGPNLAAKPAWKTRAKKRTAAVPRPAQKSLLWKTRAFATAAVSLR